MGGRSLSPPPHLLRPVHSKCHRPHLEYRRLGLYRTYQPQLKRPLVNTKWFWNQNSWPYFAKTVPQISLNLQKACSLHLITYLSSRENERGEASSIPHHKRIDFRWIPAINITTRKFSTWYICSAYKPSKNICLFDAWRTKTKVAQMVVQTHRVGSWFFWSTVWCVLANLWLTYNLCRSGLYPLPSTQ